MKGYFSQLARHTGLKFDPHRKTAGEDSSSEPVVGGNASPFEIHDVTFTEPSRPIAPEVTSASSVYDASHLSAPETSNDSRDQVVAPSDQRATAPLIEEAGLEQTGPGAQDQADVVTSTRAAPVASPEESRIQFIPTETHTGAPPAPSVKIVSVSDEQPSDNSSIKDNLKTIQPESIERYEVYQVDHREAGVVESTSLEVPPPSERVSMPAGETDQSDAHPVGPSARTRIVRDQIKEVMAWVATPPEEIQSGRSLSGVMETRTQEDDFFKRERQQYEPSSSQPMLPREPEVQDLNLSIGSISIVIEEPKPDVPVFQSPAPAESGPSERTTPEPTRLSRYYLRNW